MAKNLVAEVSDMKTVIKSACLHQFLFDKHRCILYCIFTYNYCSDKVKKHYYSIYLKGKKYG